MAIIIEEHKSVRLNPEGTWDVLFDDEIYGPFPNRGAAIEHLRTLRARYDREEAIDLIKWTLRRHGIPFVLALVAVFALWYFGWITN